MQPMANQQEQMLQVQVPEGIFGGGTMQINTPSGQQMTVAVPQGYKPGDMLQIAVPAAPPMGVPVQAQMMPAQGGMAAPMMAAPQAMGMGMGMPMGMPMGMGMGMSPAAGFEMLRQLPRVHLKEKAQLAEVLVGWEMAHKYLIADDAGRDLFIAAERSGGVMGALGRQVFEGDNRPFTMDIALLAGPGMAPIPFATLERPFACTCCCLGRPVIKVTNAATGQPMGTLHNPCACCSFEFKVNDPNDQEVLAVSTSACSCTMCCWGCPCCSEMEFEVANASTGERAGLLKKTLSGQEMMGAAVGMHVNASNYTVSFEQVSHPEYKVLLIALALFIDYQWFTTGGQSGRDNSALGRLMESNN